MPDILTLINAYSQGPSILNDVVLSVTEADWDEKPIPGTWSIRQVICHLADCEIVYADRIKRVIAEDNPTLFEADPDEFVPALHCEKRSVAAELNVIEAVRAHLLPILQSCDQEAFQRTGVHSIHGPMTLETLLVRIAGHIPHHLSYIEQKLSVLRSS